MLLQFSKEDDQQFGLSQAWQKFGRSLVQKGPHIFWLAVIYFLGAKLGQILAIPPGNVTPVWIPSGIILAVILTKGYDLWPGIFLGAFLGNVSAYFSTDSVATIVKSLIAGTANGIGDSLCATVGAFLILKYTQTTFPFNRFRHVCSFIVHGAIVGSLISAFWGVTSLCATGFLPWDQYLSVLLTWWTGDGVGVLILTPVLLSWMNRPQNEHIGLAVRLETIVYLSLITCTTFYSLLPYRIHIDLLILLPLSMWSIFRLNQEITHLSILIISGTAITFTVLNIGLFQQQNLNSILIELQLFIAVISISLLIFKSIFIEKATAQAELSHLNATLEQRIRQRTLELEQQRDSLKQSEAKIRNLIQSLYSGVVVHHADTSILLSNPRAEEILGLNLEQMQGKLAIDLYWKFIDENYQTLGIEDYPISQVLKTLKPLENMVVGILRPDRHSVTWVLVNGFPIFNPNGDLSEAIISFVDITNLKTAEEKNRHSAVVFDSTIEGIFITDLDSNIININAAFTQITGYSREEVIGQKTHLFKSGKHEAEFYQQMWDSIQQQDHWQGEIWNRRKDNSLYPALLNISAVRDDQGKKTAYVAVFSDITQIKQSEQHLNYLAHHDSLTDLPNRLLFNSCLQHSIQQALRHNSSLAVVFVDLDHFKNINDSLGHHAGDELLKQVAQRLKNMIRSNDIIARISGDEFVLLLEDIYQQDAIIIILEKLMSSFKEPFDVLETKLYISACMGVSLFPQDGITVIDLMRNADLAMYQSKEEGRNTYKFFTADLTERALHRARIENALQEALLRQEFYLMYHPQIHLQTNQIVGMEVLLRWQHLEMGMISPAIFIPIAEQNGLIRDLGRWVLLLACRQGKVWLDQGVNFGRMAINVSGKQLQDKDFASDVCWILENTAFPPQHLELEVTESFVMRVPEVSIQHLSHLKALGIQISIDDFGTGYSSLSYLKRLPIDKLKIDQTFIRDIYTDSDDMAITSSVIAMGHALGLTVIAEGVETESQAQFLKDQHCDEAQGYLYSKPLLGEDFLTFLEKWPANSPGLGHIIN
ncbi:MAG: EAL domain-containing protein [Prochlorotrichaceae cyanobacterium]|jgi:diguanylate cyclase (GGDEF)-like protein/PAS domain S-box-containing protein